MQVKMIKLGKATGKSNGRRLSGIRHPVCGIMLLALCPWALFAQDASFTLSLSNCIEMALTRSLPLANARRDEKIADATVGQVRAQVYPSLDATAEYTRLDDVPRIPGVPQPLGRENNYKASFYGEQLLYSGGSVAAALDAAKYFRDISRHEVARQRREIVRDVTKVFYELLLAVANVDVRRQSVKQLEDFVRQIRIKHEYRTASEFELLSAEVKLANERPLFVQARNRQSLVRAALRNLLYLNDEAFDVSGSLEAEPRDFDLDALYERGLRRRPELEQAISRIELARADRRVAQSDFYPEINAFGAYEGKNPGDIEPSKDEWDWGWYAGLRATWSLLDGGLRRHAVMEKALEHEKALADLAELKRSVTLEINNAYLTLEDAKEVLEGSAENVRLAEKALSIAQVRYDEGLITYLELNDSNLTLNNARFTHYRALAAYHQALADLRYACGAAPEEEDIAP